MFHDTNRIKLKAIILSEPAILIINTLNSNSDIRINIFGIQIATVV